MRVAFYFAQRMQGGVAPVGSSSVVDFVGLFGAGRRPDAVAPGPPPGPATFSVAVSGTIFPSTTSSGLCIFRTAPQIGQVVLCVAFSWFQQHAQHTARSTCTRLFRGPKELVEIVAGAVLSLK